MADFWEKDPIAAAPDVGAKPESFWEKDPVDQPAAPPPAIGYGGKAGPGADPHGASLATAGQYLHRTLDAFGQAFDGRPLGSLAPEDREFLQKHGLDPEGPNSLARAAWEAVVLPGAAALDIAVRGPQQLYQGVQQAAIAAGVPRDIVSIPDAFMGSPHMFTPAIPREGVVASPIRALEEGGPRRSQMAATGDPQIDAILSSPTTSHVIDNPVVDRSHSVPYTAGGSVPMADPTIYIDHRFPKEIEAPSVSNPAAKVKFDPAEPFVVHENVEQHAMELLIKGGMDDGAAYRVAHYEFAEKAEGAWYRAHDIDQAAAEKIYAPIMDRIQKGADDKPPENLYEKPYPHDNAHLASGPDAIDHQPTAEEIALARKIIGGDPDVPRVTGGPADTVANSLPVARDMGLIGPERAPGEVPAMSATHGAPLSRDVVVDGEGRILKPGEQPAGDFFGVRIHGDHADAANVNDLPHDDVEITHKNGAPVERPRTMLSDTGVPKDDKISEPAGVRVATDKAGNIRMDLIDKPDAVLDVMRKAAEENGGEDAYFGARRGQISLGQGEALADALGMDVKDLDLQGIGRKLQNDAMVRTAIKAMIQSADNIVAQARKANLSGADADLIELQRLRMQHSLIQEQVAGLTAEWGRTGNVFQEFSERVKDAKSLGEFLRDKKGEGETLDGLRDLAKGLSETNNPANLLAASRKPGFFDKLYYVWVNGLISGLVTHTKYLGANVGWMGYNALLVKPVAGVIGAARAALSDREIERVYVGETAAAVAGMVKGVPDALIAAAKAVRDNVPTPLPREVATGAVNAFTGVKNPFESPAGRVFGEVVGVPGRVVGGIHTFFRTLGNRVSLEEQAYRHAARDGAKPWTGDFWARQGDHSANPSDAMMDQAIADANRATFMSELGDKGSALSRAIGDTPLRWIIPFRHIPANIMKGAQEGTPLAFVSKEMRDNLLGAKGNIAQDTQWARLVVGSSIMGYLAHLVLSDRATGDGPTEPKARAEWLLTHQPGSLRIGDRWVSYGRLGPMGDLMGLGANLAEMAPYIKQGEYDQGAAHIVVAGGRWVTDAVGMQGLANMLDLMKDPERRGAIAANFASSFIPFSSGLGQSAAMFDPAMRDAKGFVDGLKNRIPGEAWGMGRESLPVKRDWLGTPVDNPMEYSILRTSKVNQDPLSAEMQRLDIWPTLPERQINGVKLGPQAYDRYQVLAGAPLSMQLHSMVNSDGWSQLPDPVRHERIVSTIRHARETAAAAMKMEYYQDLVQAPLKQKARRMTGAPPQ